MKTIVLLLIGIFTISGIHAQSKKVINQQLWGELFRLCKTRDSIENVYDNNQREVKYLRGRLVSVEKAIMVEKAYEQNIRSDIKKNHALLSQMGFDANSIVSIQEVDDLKSPAEEKDYSKNPDSHNQSFDLKTATGIQDITGLKIKAQNEQLKVQIEEYSSVNTMNKTVLAAQQSLINDLNKTTTEYSKVSTDCSSFNKQLNLTSRALKSKYTELERIKEEEAEIEAAQQAMKAANKSKNKKSSKIKFVPPVIVERDNDIDEELMNVESIDWNTTSENYEADIVPEEIRPIEKQTPEIFEITEEQAEFVGGRQAMFDYMAKNLKYPPTAIENGIEGKCYLKFVISAVGNISDVSVKRGVMDCPECDAEAVRMVKGMPDWKPAENNGVAVNSWYTLPIQFKLN